MTEQAFRLIRSDSCPPGQMFLVAPDSQLAQWLAIECLMKFWRWL